MCSGNPALVELQHKALDSEQKLLKQRACA
jgi:hypothetical protein